MINNELLNSYDGSIEKDLEIKKELLKDSKQIFKLGIFAYSVIYIAIIVEIFLFKDLNIITMIMSLIMIFVSMYFLKLNIKAQEMRCKFIEQEIEEKKQL